MEKVYSQQNITVSNLYLWDENARFPDKYYNSNENELLSYFLSKPDFKIQQLVDAIIKDFDLPQLEKLVVWENSDKYIVLEGNRRLAAYKLLINPKLASDIALIKYLEEQKSKIDISDNYILECLVTTDKDEGYRYIDRKHAHGNNEVNWQDAERAHYSVRRGSKTQIEFIKIGLTKIVRDLDLPEELKDKVLGRKYVTNFFRLVTSGSAKKEFGFEVDPNGKLTFKDVHFREKLKIIIYNVLKGEDFNGKPVNSRQLNRKPEIEKYLKSINTGDVSKVDEAIKIDTTRDIFGDEKITIRGEKPNKVFRKSTDRIYLIPKTCRLSISETKINNVYLELRDNLILDGSKNAVPNAVGVLFRVFLEISIDYFLEKEGVRLPNKKTILAGKITKCSEILEKNGIAYNKQLKNIRKVATDQNNILGIQNFHDYVHSYKSQPTSNDLKIKWDNLEEFFQILWDYLFNKYLKKKI